MAILALTFAASAAGRGVRAHGPARYWGGTAVDPGPPVPLPSAPGSTVQVPTAHPPPATRRHHPVHPDQVLSNEFTYTQWAYVAQVADAYWMPTTHSRVITRLTQYTEDGFTSVYLALRSYWDKRDREWILIRIPGRPNGRTGWVLRDALGQFNMTHLALTVNREQMRMYFYDDGRRVWSAPVGVGQPSMPTPTGHFWINEEFTLPTSNPYYPFAFGTTDASTLSDWPGGGWVGIHGPYGAPWSAIPGQISHGCIRLHVPDAAWLGHHLQIGTPLDVV
jgi:hypothetical protein